MYSYTYFPHVLKISADPVTLTLIKHSRMLHAYSHYVSLGINVTGCGREAHKM